MKQQKKRLQAVHFKKTVFGKIRPFLVLAILTLFSSNISAAIRYVRTTGADAGTCTTAATPCQTIQYALGQSVAGDEIRVAGGIYNVDYTGLADQIILQEDIDLVGGYDPANWGSRNPVTFVTSIRDMSASGGIAISPTRAIQAGAGITSATIVDGFSLVGSTSGADYSAGIFIFGGAQPLFQNNVITGGSGTTASYGVFITDNNSNPTISSNSINGGTGVTDAYGIYLTNLSKAIITSNSSITGGSGAGSSRGIYTNSTTAGTLISGNTINGGSKPVSTGISVNSGAIPTIDNSVTPNNINGGDGTSISYGVFVSGVNSNPSITGNSINGGTTATSQGIYVYNNARATVSNNLISGGAGTGSTGIYFNSSIAGTVISGNNVDGGSGTTNGYAFYITGAGVSPVVERNRIFGGSGSGGKYGVYSTSSATATIRNNIISGGASTSFPIAVGVYGPSSPIIYNNSVFTGSSSSGGMGVYIGSGTPQIKNNIFFTDGHGSSKCVVRGASGNPSSVRNNDFFKCSAAMYDDNGIIVNEVNTTSITTGEGTQTLGFWGNVSVIADFSNLNGADNDINTMADNDWSLASAFPELAQGAVDGSGTGFTNDFAGTGRTTATPQLPQNPGAQGWTMGAYEYTASADVIAYTHTAGLDTNPGTQAKPTLTINQAMAQACNAASCPAGSREVHVAGGTYNVTYLTNHIILKEGVSLMGGYNTGGPWTDRNITVTAGVSYITTISDNSGGGTVNPGSAVFEAGTGISTATLIEGFTINGANSSANNCNTAILINGTGSPTIQQNKITAGSVSGTGCGGTNRGTAIHITATGSPLIRNNHAINGGANGGGGSMSAGIYVTGGSATIQNNTLIYSGNGTGNKFGIIVIAGSPTITGNTEIVGGANASSWAVYASGGTPIIENNYVNGGTGGTNTYGVAVTSASAVTVRNNRIFGGSGTTSSIGYRMTSGTASHQVYNNLLHGGSAPTSRGISLNSASATDKIRNNTIYSGTGGTTSYAIDVLSGTPNIDNNIITCGGTGTKRAINEGSANPGSDPASVNNNDFDPSCTTLYYDSNSVSVNNLTTNITNSATNTLQNWGNISVTANFTNPTGGDANINTMADNDWTLTNPQPADLLQGGIDGSTSGWVFGSDIMLSARTNSTSGSPTNPGAGGWTIGAYENNGATTSSGTYYTRNGGTFSTATNWSTASCGGVAAATSPPNNADVIICGGHTISLTGSTIVNNLTIGDGASVSELDTTASNHTLTINGNILIGDSNGAANSDSLKLNDSMVEVYGNFTMGTDGQYLRGNSYIRFRGTSPQVLSYSNLEVHNIEITGGKTVTLPAGSTLTTWGSLFLEGDTMASRLLLRSSSPGTPWQLNSKYGVNTNLIDLQDSNATLTGYTLTAYNAVNSGNNTSWNFGSTALFSMTTGNYNATSSWSYSGCGKTQVSAGVLPTSTTYVRICNTHAITLTADADAGWFNLENSATLNGGSYVFSVHENFYKNSAGTFNPQSGTIRLNGNGSQGQEVYGDNIIFNNLTIPGNGVSRTIRFNNGYTFTVNGNFNASGTNASQMLELKSNSDGNAFNLVLNGTITSTGYLNVKDSSASGTALSGAPPTVLNIAQTETSVNSGNNTAWFALLPGYYFVAASGNWSTLADWRTDGCGGATTPGVLPTSADHVTICSGASANLDMAGVSKNFTVASGGTFTANAQTLTIHANATRVGTFNRGTSTVIFAGNSTVTGFGMGPAGLHNAQVAPAGFATTIADDFVVNGMLTTGSGILTSTAPPGDGKPVFLWNAAGGSSLTLDPGVTITDRIFVVYYFNAPGGIITGGDYKSGNLFVLSNNQTAVLGGDIATTGAAIFSGDLSVAGQTGIYNTAGYKIVSGSFQLGSLGGGGPPQGNATFTETGVTVGEVFQAVNLQIYAGSSLTLSDAELRVSGNFTNNGTLTAGTSTVSLNGIAASTQTIVGNSNFYNLSLINNGNRIIRFTDASTTNVSGQFSALGNAGNLLELRPTGVGTWNLNLSGSKGTLDYLLVENSNASGSSAILKPVLSGAPASNSTNLGTNTDWFAGGSLIAHYQLNGNANDVLGTNNGTINGGATPAQERHAINSGAMNFNGTTGYISATSAGFPMGSASRTMCVWVNPATLASAVTVAGYGTAANSQGFGFALNNVTTIFFGYANDVDYPTPMPTNRWSHLCGSYDGATAKLYINGKMVLSQAKTWNTVAGNFYIGQQLTGTEKFNGNIDDLRLYNYAMTDAEIVNLYSIKKWKGTNVVMGIPAGDGSSWNDANNWIPSGVPAVSDDVILDNTYTAGAYTVNLPGASVTVGNFDIGGAGPPILNTNTQVFTVNQHFTQTAGTINGGGTIVFAGTTDGPFNFSQSGGTISANANLDASAKVYQLNANTTIDGNLFLTSGTLNTNNGSGPWNLTIGPSPAVARNLTIGDGAGGTATLSANTSLLTISGSISRNTTDGIYNYSSSQTVNLTGTGNVSGFGALSSFGSNSFFNLNAAAGTYNTTPTTTTVIYNQLSLGAGTFNNNQIVRLENMPSSVTDTPYVFTGTTITGTNQIMISYTKDANGKFPGGSFGTNNVRINSGTGDTVTFTGAITTTGQLIFASNTVSEFGLINTANYAITASSLEFGNFDRAVQVQSGSSVFTISGNVVINNDTGAEDTNWVSTGTINIGGNLINNEAPATINFSGASVNFNGTGAQSVTGNFTFNNLTFADSGARTITLPAGGVQTVSGTFAAPATAGKVISLRSSSSPTQATITVNGAIGATTYLDIQDNVINGTAWSANINPANSTDSGNNAGWFSPLAVLYSRVTGNFNDTNTWSGVVCGGAQVAAGVTPTVGTNITICGGHTVTLTQNEAVNLVTINGVLDLVTYNVDITGTLNNSQTINSSAGASITFKGTNNATADTYTISTNNNTMPTLIFNNIEAGATVDTWQILGPDLANFGPGDFSVVKGIVDFSTTVGVRAHGMKSMNLSGGTLIMGDDIFTVSDNWQSTGTTIQSQTSTVTFSATSAGKTITPGAGNFYNVDFNGAGGGWSLSGANMIVLNNYNHTTGDLNYNGRNVEVSKNAGISGGSLLETTFTENLIVRENYAQTNGTVDVALRLEGTVAGPFTINKTGGSVKSVIIAGAPANYQFTNNFITTSSCYFDSGVTIDLNNRSFTCGGDLTVWDVTLNTTGGGNLSVAGTAFNFHDGTLNLGTGSHSFVNVTLGDAAGGTATLNGNTSSITFTGNLTTNTDGVFTAGTSTVNFSGTASQTIIGNHTFNNVSLADSGARTIIFPDGGTQIVSGAFTAPATIGKVISLRSQTATTQTTITVNGSVGAISYLNVQDHIINGTAVASAIDPANSTNSGNTSGWFSVAGGILYTRSAGAFGSGANWTTQDCAVAPPSRLAALTVPTTTHDAVICNGDAIVMGIPHSVNSLEIREGSLSTGVGNHALTITTNLNIGDGLGAANSATLNANESIVTLSGSFTRMTVDGRFERTGNQRVVMNGNGTISNMGGSGTLGPNNFARLDAAYPGFTTNIPANIEVGHQLVLNGGALNVGGGAYLTVQYYSSAVATNMVDLNNSTLTGTGFLDLLCRKDSLGVIEDGNYGTVNLSIRCWNTTINGANNNGTGAITTTGNVEMHGPSAGVHSTLNLNGLNLSALTINVGNGGTQRSATLNAGAGTIQATQFTVNNSLPDPVSNFNLTGTLNVTGNFTNNSTGTVNLTSSTVNLNGTGNQSVLGTSNTAFHNLTLNTTAGGKIISFTAGRTNTVANTFTAAGSAGNVLTLASATPGSQTTLTVNGPALVPANYSYLSVQDQILNGTAWSVAINPANSTNLGNNQGWFPIALLYSRANGDWSAASTWSDSACGAASAGAVPNSAINVEICAGHAVTVTTVQAGKNLTMNGAGSTLTVSQALTIHGNLSITNGTIGIDDAQNMTLLGSFTQGGGSIQPTATTGKINLAATSGGPISISQTAGTTTAIFAIGGTQDYTMATNLTVAKFVHSGSGTFSAGANGLTTSAEFTQSGGAFNAGSGSHLMQGIFSLTAGTFSAQTSTIQFTGSAINNTGTFTEGNSTVNLASGGGIAVNNAMNFYNLAINGNATFSSASRAVSNNFVHNVGTLNLADGGTLTVNNFSKTNGNLVVGPTGAATLQANGTWSHTGGILTVAGGDIVRVPNAIALGIASEVTLHKSNALTAGDIPDNSALYGYIFPYKNVYIRVADPSRNFDSTVQDTLVVTITSNGAPAETESITLTETGPFSGVFATPGAGINTAQTTATASNSIIEAQANNVISLEYSDAYDALDTNSGNRHDTRIADGSIFVWDGGGGDGLFNTATNWLQDTVPGITDRVRLDNTQVSTCYTVTSAVAVQVDELELNSTCTPLPNPITLSLNNANITVRGRLAVTAGRVSRFAATENLIVAGGGSTAKNISAGAGGEILVPLQVNTADNYSLTTALQLTDLTKSGAGTLDLSGNTLVLSGSLGIAGGGFTSTGSLVRFVNTSPVTISSTINPLNLSLLQLNGTSTVNIADGLQVNVSGAFAKSGGALVVGPTGSSILSLNGSFSHTGGTITTAGDTISGSAVAAQAQFFSDPGYTTTIANNAGATGVLTNGTVYIQVTDYNANKDATVAEVLPLVTTRLRTPSLTEDEPVTLTETGNSTGIFRGSITVNSLMAAVANDGTYSFANGDVLRLFYQDADNAGDTLLFETKVGDTITGDVTANAKLTGNSAKIADNYLDFRKKTKTIIGFNLAKDGTISVHVFDSRGRKLKTIHSQTYPAGNSFYNWDVRTEDLRSGLYYLHVESSSWSKPEVMKIVVVR